MRSFAISAVGRDHPGIVAAVTAPLAELGLNIADSEMAILRGHFAMMLVVVAKDEPDLQRLESLLAEVQEELELEVLSVRPLDQFASDYPAASHTITVYGADHPGIVHAAAEALAANAVNIVDLSTRLTGEEEGRPLYVMMIDVVLAEGMEGEELAGLLAEVGREQQVEVSVQELEQDAL